MGFFATEKEDKRSSRDPSEELLHNMGCKLCPLDRIKSNHNPHMEPTGAEKPLVYILGEAPDKEEDEKGEQFVGLPGRLLRSQIPRKYDSMIRWNNVVRTRPMNDATPQRTEIECCRPSIVRDIETSKPKIILGFGAVPLVWISKRSGISDWRGRRFPVQVGSHRCWYYPMMDPSYIARLRNKKDKTKSEKADWEHVFNMDIKNAFADLDDLPPPMVHTRAHAEDGVEWVIGKAGDLDRIARFLQMAATQPELGLDYETNALRPYRTEAKILTAAVSVGAATLAFPFHHPQARWQPSELRRLEQIWAEFLHAPRVVKAAHNLPFEMEWSAVKFGTDVLRAGEWADTMVQAAIIDERVGNSKPGCLSLDFLTQLHFGMGIKALSHVNTKNIAAEPLDVVLRYNGIDAKYHLRLYQVQKEILEQENLMRTYELHLPRIPTVVLTQIRGLEVDFNQVAALEVKYKTRLEDIEAQILDMDCCKQFAKKYGRDYNPKSNDDGKDMFLGILNREEGWRDEKKYSVDEDTLMAIDHPLAKLLLEHRHSAKRYGTYVEPLKQGSTLVYEDGKLHPIINTVFAETGRTTSEAPNEQNFPKRDSEARELRRQIYAPKGQLIVACDYGQIQVRNIAMESQDQVLHKYLWDRHDFHMDWAKRLAEAYPPRIGGEEFLEDKKALKTFRTDVKNQWSFPLFFGAALSTAAYYLKMPERVVRPVYEDFWDTFAGVKAWQEKLVETYKRKGYVENLTGRRRRAPLTVNQIINSPIQADEADIVLNAMQRLSETGDPQLQAIMNIHDDLTFQLNEETVESYVRTIVEAMIYPPFDFISVPISVEVSVGTNWCDLEEAVVAFSDTWPRE